MIIKAHKKPVEITVIRARDIDKYREEFHIEVNNAGNQVWNKPQNQFVNFNPTDYIRVDNPNDIYPINKEYFEENYLVKPE